MIKQIFEIEEIVGMTVEKIVEISDSKLAIKFKDCFVVLEADYCAGESELNVMLQDFNLNPDAWNCNYLLELGVISEAECNKVMSDFHAKNDRLKRENEIKKLNELKSKYPDFV